MTEPPHRCETAFAAAWPARRWCDVHVVLAVSGGADSVALLRAATAIKHRSGGAGRLWVAHLNHRLRGAQADADQAWLVDLCRQLDVPLEVGRADVTSLAGVQGDGWEAAGRTARYDFLREVAHRRGARYVAVGHTADDQVETVVHRLVRGTGLAGLAGMPSVRPLSPTVSLVRPLLHVPRRDVLAYLGQLGQGYRRDATNFDPRFTRNRLRQRLLPLVREEFNPEFDRAVLRLAQQAGEMSAALAELAGQWVARCVAGLPTPMSEQSGRAQRWSVDCRGLADQPTPLVREVFRLAWRQAGWPQQAMGFDQWQQLALLAGSGGEAAECLPGGVLARRIGDRVELRPAPDKG